MAKPTNHPKKSKAPPKKLEKSGLKDSQPIEKPKVSKATKTATKSKELAIKSKKTPKAPKGKAITVDSQNNVDTVIDREQLDALYETLPYRHKMFIEEYLVDLNATQAAMRAGFSKGGASSRGYEMMQRPEVRAIIDARQEDRIERVRMTIPRLLGEYEDQVEADFNELVELRRVNCRHCWGIDHRYQYNAAELEEALEGYNDRVIEATAKGVPDEAIKPFDEKGGIGFLPHKDPNPECPICGGDGHPHVFFKDSRNLSRRARALYAGAEFGKDGLKVKGHSKEKAMEVLAKSLGIFKDDSGSTGGNTDYNLIAAIFAEGMMRSADMMAKVRQERGLDGG